MTDPNRIDPLAPPPKPDAEASPTGAPLLPPKYVPHAIAILTALGGIAALPTMGVTLIPVGICHAALVATIVLAPLLGVASPGLRKK